MSVDFGRDVKWSTRGQFCSWEGQGAQLWLDYM